MTKTPDEVKVFFAYLRYDNVTKSGKQINLPDSDYDSIFFAF
jgi:hypothetical protein